MKTERQVPHPFLKWVGGKTRVMGRVVALMPTEINTYYEPFLGGGAVFFELWRQKRFERAVLSDTNSGLVALYETIRDDLDGLVTALAGPEFVYGRSEYLAARALDPSELTKTMAAARFLYLNRTCFNGLYRVNRSGGFNVPFGKYDSPKIVDRRNLDAVQEALASGKVSISCGGFDAAVGSAGSGDCVYFDPPYVPISATSSFTGYAAGGFSEVDHRSLAETFDGVVASGASAILSNSGAPLSRELYALHEIHDIPGPRAVGGPRSRKSVVEIVVKGVSPTALEKAIVEVTADVREMSEEVRATTAALAKRNEELEEMLRVAP